MRESLLEFAACPGPPGRMTQPDDRIEELGRHFGRYAAMYRLLLYFHADGLPHPFCNLCAAPGWRTHDAY